MASFTCGIDCPFEEHAADVDRDAPKQISTVNGRVTSFRPEPISFALRQCSSIFPVAHQILAIWNGSSGLDPIGEVVPQAASTTNSETNGIRSPDFNQDLEGIMQVTQKIQIDP